MADGPLRTNRLILCEGIEDAAFLRALIRKRSLGAFDIRAVEDVGGVSGITGFAKALETCVTLTGFRTITSVGLIADSDEQHGRTFASVRRQIERANRDPNVSGRFDLPTAAFTRSGGHPRITIILNPAPSSNGCLETLLLNAARTTHAHLTKLEYIEEMANNVGIVRGAMRWHYSKVDKVRLHTLIAVTNRKNPAVGLVRLWAQYPSFIDLNDHAFDDIAARLTAL